MVESDNNLKAKEIEEILENEFINLEILSRSEQQTVLKGINSKKYRFELIKAIECKNIEGKEEIDWEEFQNTLNKRSLLSHEHILEIYDIKRIAKEEYIYIFVFMEYCESKLESIIGEEEESRSRSKSAKTYLREIVSGLAYLHAQNPLLIHCDLTPNNIFLQEGNIKIGEFTTKRALNKTNEISYTLNYAPPELFQRLPLEDNRITWMIGCIYYELIEGKKAFEGPQLMENIKNIVFPAPTQADSVDSMIIKHTLVPQGERITIQRLNQMFIDQIITESNYPVLPHIWEEEKLHKTMEGTGEEIDKMKEKIYALKKKGENVNQLLKTPNPYQF